MVFLKKVLLLIISLSIVLFNMKDESVVIPDKAIRLRVIANDNSKISQGIKFEYNAQLNNYLNKLIGSSNSYDDIDEIIKTNIDNIDSFTLQFLLKNGINYGYDINYGKNYFPNKEYNGIKYSEGFYNSLVITLGEGKGKNWWCVLFPPLCNFDNNSIDDVNYKSYVLDLLDRYN